MSDGTLQTLDVTMLDDVNNASGLIQLDSNAKIPACSGAALTNLPGVTKNASDPAIATNPSGGVGSVWQNTTSGAMFICTDATAGANVWTNIGEGTGNIVPYVLQGSSYGYACGGYNGKNGPTSHYGYAIEKYSLTSDGNATDVGDITSVRRGCKGHSSSTHGYITGGNTYPTPLSINVIERFPFASDTDSVDWADLTETTRNMAAMANTGTHGFTMGGDGTAAPYYTNVIDKFPFASQTNATDWADMTATVSGSAGCSYISGCYGYSLGGNWQAPSSPTGYNNTIEKFPFASQTNSVDVADITIPRSGCCGVSSTTDGYCIGGFRPGGNPANSSPTWTSDIIDKHSFASGGNATDHGDIPAESGAGASSAAGASGTTHAYYAGGMLSYNQHNHGRSKEQIQKFAYASNVTASEVGDLIDFHSTGVPDWGKAGPSGHQV